MADKLILDRPIVVEGKYDKIRLASLIDSEIIVSDGFGIFKAKEKAAMIRRIAAKKGIIVLTDSDGGGLVIRNYFRSILPAEQVVHLYIPEIKGRERRKTEDSKAGLLGVEGMENDLLRELLSPFSVDASAPSARRPITKADLDADGLSGGKDSAVRRERLCVSAGLPRNISASALLEVLNLLYTYEDYQNMAAKTAEE